VFSIFAYSGALLLAMTFISLGHCFGEQWYQVLEPVQKHLLICTWIAF